MEAPNKNPQEKMMVFKVVLKGITCRVAHNSVIMPSSQK